MQGWSSMAGPRCRAGPQCRAGPYFSLVAKWDQVWERIFSSALYHEICRLPWSDVHFKLLLGLIFNLLVLVK